MWYWLQVRLPDNFTNIFDYIKLDKHLDSFKSCECYLVNLVLLSFFPTSEVSSCLEDDICLVKYTNQVISTYWVALGVALSLNDTLCDRSCANLTFTKRWHVLKLYYQKLWILDIFPIPFYAPSFSSPCSIYAVI